MRCLVPLLSLGILLHANCIDAKFRNLPQPSCCQSCMERSNENEEDDADRCACQQTVNKDDIQSLASTLANMLNSSLQAYASPNDIALKIANSLKKSLETGGVSLRVHKIVMRELAKHIMDPAVKNASRRNCCQ